MLIKPYDFEGSFYFLQLGGLGWSFSSAVSVVDDVPFFWCISMCNSSALGGVAIAEPMTDAITSTTLCFVLHLEAERVWPALTPAMALAMKGRSRNFTSNSLSFLAL